MTGFASGPYGQADAAKGGVYKEDAMRIIAINGSHRGERGYIHFLIRKLFEGAAAVGAECEVVTLAGLKVNRCLACEKCVIDMEKRCVQDDRDDVRSILNRMESADIIDLSQV